MVERYANIPKTKITFDEAISLIEAMKRPKEVAHKQADDHGNFGYFSLDEIRSPMDLPPFRASLKDAARSVDGNSDRLTMSKPISAGDSDCDRLEANRCYRINTGSGAFSKYTHQTIVDYFFFRKLISIKKF